MINYNNYVQEITKFLRTMTIKNKWFAERSRQEYAARNNVAPEDVSWYKVPYYWDICGLTHPEYPDKHSAVNLTNVSASYQTVEGEPWELSRTTIQDHPGVLSALRWPDTGMGVLCENYPDDIDYIKSIVYAVQPPDTIDGIARTLEIDLGTVQREYYSANMDPSATDQIDIDKHVERITELYSLDDEQSLADLGIDVSPEASEWDKLRLYILTRVIKADHLELLAYDTIPLEPWERTSLLNSVQQTLAWIRDRWCIDAFTNEENYSPLTWVGVWGTLARELHVQRLENARTAPVFWNEDIPIAERRSEHLHPVHSYHIREFLASKGLSDYTGVLDRRQSLFLYHNLNWLIAHRGTGKVLNVLSDYILEPERSELRSFMMMSSAYGAEDECRTIPEFISTSLREDREPTQMLGIKRNGLPRLIERTVNSGLEPVDEDSTIVPKLTNQTQSASYTKHRTPFLEIDRMPLYEGMEERFLKFSMGTFLHEWEAGRLNDDAGDSIEVNLGPNYLGYNVEGTVEDLVLLMYYVSARLNGMVVSGVDAISLPTQFECRNIVPTPTTASVPTASTITWLNVDDPPNAFLTEGDLPTKFDWFKWDTTTTPTSVIHNDIRIASALHHTTDGSDIWEELLPIKGDGQLRYIAEQTTLNYPEHRYASLDQLMNEVDRRFLTFFDLIRSYRNAATPTSQEALRQLIRASTTSYVFEHTYSYSSWDDWLASKSGISGIVTIHENEEQEYATWAALAEFLISKTLRIMTSRWVAQDHLSEYKYDKLIELFKQLTSYSSCYLDRSQQTKTHWRELQACGMNSLPSGGGKGATVSLSSLMTANTYSLDITPV